MNRLETFGLLGAAWVPFWVLWARLATFLGALGVAWAPFWGLWGCFGLHFGCSGGPMGGVGGPWGPPWPPKAPKVKFPQILPIFSLSFWGHFGYISDVKTVPKSDVIVD